MLLLYILIAAAIIATGVIFALTKLGKIVDVDGNGIPDAVEEKIEDAKYRAQRIKEEVSDVIEASKEVVAQIKDIKGAAKGETRKGRKKQ
jgi:beta-lactam-binding protein with PASTA domain